MPKHMGIPKIRRKNRLPKLKNNFQEENQWPVSKKFYQKLP